MIGVHHYKIHGRPDDMRYISDLQPAIVGLIASGRVDVQWLSDMYVTAPNARYMLRNIDRSEQHDAMHRLPAETGRRHAEEWAAEVATMREEAERRRIPFPASSRLIVLGINEPVMDAPDPGEMRRRISNVDIYNAALLSNARSRGLTVGALSLAPGGPTNWGVPGGAPDWGIFPRTKQEVMTGGHPIVLHEYWADKGPTENWGWWAGRFQKCDWNCPIIIGECGVDYYVKSTSVPAHKRGWQAWMDANRYAGELIAYAEECRKDGRIIAILPFTTDFTGQWASFDTAPVHPQLVAHQKSLPVVTTGYVTATAGLRLRAAGNIEAETKKIIGYGQAVTILGRQGDWYRVNHKEDSGWLFAEFVSTTKPITYSDSFEKIVAFILKEEGGYQANPKDKGNWTGGAVGVGELKGTKYGISAAAYPALDIKNLSELEAREIYHRDYWIRAKVGDLPTALAALHMNAAVNAGVGQANHFLANCGGSALLYASLQMTFYTGLADWDWAGKAWVSRLARAMKV